VKATKCRIGRLTNDVLSDDVLLYIFHLYQPASDYYILLWAYGVKDGTWPWRTLAHVCQRWRRIIFAWPNQLGVWVECKSGTDVAKVLDVWPTLPITIWLDHKISDGDEIIAGLKYHDRIAGINLSGLTGPQLERCAVLMQKSFPILRTLSLQCHAEIPPVLTDAFLGGSAPRLRKLNLCHIPCLSLSGFLLTARDLVKLHLDHIPSTGYFSPDTMATCMSMLPKLKYVAIVFHSQKSFPNLTNICPPPAACAFLPALVRFEFKGVIQYSEDLMARINAPRLNRLSIEFFYQPIFDLPQLPQFIRYTERLNQPIHAEADFGEATFSLLLRSYESVGGGVSQAILTIQCTGSDKQISLFEQICTQCSHVISVGVLELLFHSAGPWHYILVGQQSSARLLEALHLFDVVETLFIDGDELLITVANALGNVTPERAAEVLPMLHTIEGRNKWGIPAVIEAISPFLDARWETDHPVDMEWVNI
jgi:hypothetical protein